MTHYTFKWTTQKGGVELRLQSDERDWLRRIRRQLVSRESWPDANQLHAVSALARLEVLLQDAPVEVRLLADGNGYWVADGVLAALTESQAKALNLPRNITYELRLDVTGPVSDADTKIVAKWHDTSGRVSGGTNEGALFHDAKGYSRIPEPTYRLLRSISSYNGARDLLCKTEALVHVKNAIQSVTGVTAIDCTEQLRELRLAHATSVSLDIKVIRQQIDIDPELFSKTTVAAALASGHLVAAREQLLTETQQQKFVQQFRRKPTARSTYVLGSGEYVLIDQSAVAVLHCVKKAQQSSAEYRARFARSPQSFVKEHLLEQGFDDEAADAAIEHAFVETDVYSARVRDIGLWQPPVLPFIKRMPNQWLPEKLGLQIGDDCYPIDLDSLPHVVDAVRKARAKGEPFVEIAGCDKPLPVTECVSQALEKLVDALEPAPEGRAGADDPPETTAPVAGASKSVLGVVDNFEDEGFNFSSTRRAHFTEFVKPSGLLSSPKQHQVDGIGWLQHAWCQGYSGVLLADDMGLGKTFQTLAFLSWLFEQQRDAGKANRPTLVMAPASLLGTWQEEAQRHISAKALGRFELLYGSHLKALKKTDATGNDIVTGSSTLNTRRLGEAQWILTTYETMRDYHISLASLPLACAVFDEMQKIKNPGSLMTHAAQTLNADFKLGLTGTPVENSLADIWTLLDTLQPGYLGALKPFMKEHNPENHGALRNLKQRLQVGTDGHAPLMLRRMKSEVAKDLPRKTERIVDEEMPAAQAQEYSKAVSQGLASDRGKNDAMQAFQRIRSVSLHPNDPRSESSSDGDQYIAMSARLIAVFRELDKIHALGEKALVFIESIAMHEWLALYLKERYEMPRLPDRIYGAIAPPKRAAIVSRFQDRENRGFDVLLLSPKAAGVGLTLTQATHVIHLSRWWNPAVEDQCTDRAYRIGQDRDVTVYYPRALHPLYGESSFDGILHDLLHRKRALSRDMLTPMETGNEINDILEVVSGVTNVN